MMIKCRNYCREWETCNGCSGCSYRCDCDQFTDLDDSIIEIYEEGDYNDRD